jgi:site-specific DNA recombinase
MNDATFTADRPAVARGYARSAAPSPDLPIYDKRAIVYLRVSTLGQASTNRDGEAFSIAAQREACVRRIEDLGAAFVGEYIDAGESARSADRPQLQAMLARLASARDIDYVVVHKLDRLARDRGDDVQITLAIRKAGARLVSVAESIDETPSGMLVHGIMSTIAEFYSRNLATEILKGMDQKAKKGGLLSRAPVGYLNVPSFDGLSSKPLRSIELDPERADLVRWAFEAYATGDYTLRQLTEALADRGLTTRPTRKRPAAPLYVQNVHRMLLNRVYVGLVPWKGNEYPGRHEPLVSVETFATVQAILHSRAMSREKPSTQGHYLRGSLFCARCGATMGFIRAKGRYEYFFCFGRHQNKGCDLPYVSADVVESQVEAFYEPVQVSGETVLQFKDRIFEHMKSRLDGAEKLAGQARKRIVRLEAERRRLLQAHLAGAVPMDLLKEEQDRMTRELAQAGGELANTEMDWQEVQERVSSAIGLASQLHDVYLRAIPAMRKRINQACWDGFDVDVGGVVGAKLSDPLAALIADDLIRTIGAENKNHDLRSSGRGSRLSSLVEVSGLEPPTSTLRTWRSTS